MRELDRIDRKILDLLQKEGRLSMTELAQRVGLSPTPCTERVRRLEREGVITGYHARVDPRALGRPLLVFVELKLSAKSNDTFDRVRKELAFVQLQEMGWHGGSCFETGINAYPRVIAEGEAYLEAHPKSAHRAHLLLQVAQAHETAWTVSQAAAEDEFASASSVGAEAGEAARKRAISLYREIVRDFPSSEAVASSAREALPRLELGLTNQQWKHFCICC